jgi:phage terminase small subunit
MKHGKGQLTDRQEKFVQELIKGKSQREAYRAVYGCKGWKDKSIDNRASKLFNTSAVMTRYKELHAKAVSKSELTAEQVRAMIIEQLYKISTGELKKEEYMYTAGKDGEGERLAAHKVSVEPSVMRSAASDLAAYFGVTPAQQIDHDIVIKYADDEEDYAD